MALSDDDEDLRQAIALSLQDLSAGGVGETAHEAISLDSDSETEEKSTGAAGHSKGEGEVSGSSVGQGVLGLDRKQMEQERLARKRKAPSISPPPLRKAAASDPPVASAPVKSATRQALQATVISQASSGSNGTGPVFITGTVKKTWAFGHERKHDDIKLEEVLQKNDLNLAVLSSFQWEIDWLLAKINTRSTQITLVMQAKDLATQQQYRRETAAMSNLRLCFPSMEGQISCMHSKLMLLSHPTHLRVAVPTANLVSYDWGETGIMENMVFLIDVPRLPKGQRATAEDMTFFATELIYFLEAMGLEQTIIDSMYNFDFTKTKDLAFVHNIGGAHFGELQQRTGYCGLGRAVKELGLATDKPLQIDFVTSSVGSLNDDFLSMIYLAAQGDDGLTEYNWRNPPIVPKRKKTPQEDLQAKDGPRERLRSHLRQNFQVYHPTHETVKSSTAGSAGTIWFQSKWYNSPTFPREILRDCKSVRPGMLMHNKLLFIHPKDDPTKFWAYVGSANCSESAWGKLFKDRATKEPKLNCRNWECGVLVPVRPNISGSGEGDLKEFEGIVPVPMQVPGEEYGDKKPWYFTEQ
ncbi:MAG: hypothetical protein ASARMPRED_001852 [Alectoria sarmentosa]|nr:MAG: hypothetical protein ASARMPRED_001852 [Alectoria sarmentosa]